MKSGIIIGVVGTCGTGKSELVSRLKAAGYEVRHIAQEHSYAPRMWKQIAHPDILVYLEVSFPKTLERKSFTWTEKEFQEQLYRLRNAREHADIRINTDDMTPDEILALILKEIKNYS
jgi:broad-specificity NMP kinase